MKVIGEQLADGRAARGMSITQLQKGTKLQSRYLIALEKGDFSVLPGEAYVKPFIRLYAKYVGLDAEPLVQRYDDLRAQELQECLDERYCENVDDQLRERLGNKVRSQLSGALHRLGIRA